MVTHARHEWGISILDGRRGRDDGGASSQGRHRGGASPNVSTCTAALALLLLSAVPATAEPTPLRWSRGQSVADAVSTGLVAGALAGDTWNSWRSEQRGRAFRCQAMRTGLDIAIAETAKRLIHRDRPNHRDRFSMPSEHTMLATAGARGSGWSLGLQIGVPVATGYGRQAAGWHYASDVGVGAVIALAVHQVCDKEQER